MSWLRPKLLTATTNAAEAIFSFSDSASGRSNSSGPWTVKLYGGPPRRRQRSATAAGFVPKWACRWVAPSRFSHPRSRQASARYPRWTRRPRSERAPILNAAARARQKRNGRVSAPAIRAPAREITPPPSSTFVFSRSALSAASTTSDSSVARIE
jgi:hypothetical protein